MKPEKLLFGTLAIICCISETKSSNWEERSADARPDFPSMSDLGASKPSRKVGLVGLGAIGNVVAQSLSKDARYDDDGSSCGVLGAELAAILVTDPTKHQEKQSWLPEAVVLTNDTNVFFSSSLSVIVEACGQPWVREHGERVLCGGIDLLVTSTGALTDPLVKQTLFKAASSFGSGRLLLASGAMPAVDWMQAAAINGGVHHVTLKQSKPPSSWVGTAAEGQVRAVTDWQRQGPMNLFEGSAREAASRFPKSSNVAATLGLATAGLDKTQVQLVADPGEVFRTDIELKAACGRLVVHAEHYPSETNPKTSADVALSVIRSLRAICSPVVYGI